MKYLSVNQVPQVIAQLCARGARPFTILYKTSARLLKKGRTTKVPHQFGEVSAVKLVNTILNFNYGNSVNRQRVRENKDEGFVPSGQIHYEHIPGQPRPIVRSKNDNSQLYLQLKTEKTIDTRFINAEGVEFDRAELAAADVLPALNKNTSQGLDKEVYTFAVSLDNIIAFRCDNETYFVGKAAKLEQIAVEQLEEVVVVD